VDATRQPVFNVPFIVLAMVAVLGLIHAVFTLALTEEQTDGLLRLFAFLPVRYDWGFPVGLLPGGWGAGIWTFVTYALIHADLNHLIFNLLWLVAFGTPVARRFGALRFIAFFVVTAAAGAAAHLVTHFGEAVPMIGASASVSGAMAAAMRFAFQRGGPLGLLRGREASAYLVPAAPLSAMLRDPRLLAFLLVWFGVNLLFGLGTFKLPGIEQSIAWEGHIGGFLAGLLGFSLFDPVRNLPALADPEEPNQQSEDASMDH
jgi:membrane associated rhomboid family serine protease